MGNLDRNYSTLTIPHFPLADRLTRRWVDFGRLLRRNGVAVTAGQMRDLLRALSLLDLKDRNEIYFASRAMLCASKEDLPKFDLTFRQFWARTRQIIMPSDTGSLEERRATSDERRLNEVGEGGEKGKERPILPAVERTMLSDSEGEGQPGEEDEEEQITQALLYSAQERLRKLDFAHFTEEELTAARALMTGWEWKPGMRRTRRLTARKRGRRLDAARTMRRAMRTEGIPTHSLGERRAQSRARSSCCATSAARWPLTHG